MVKEISISKMKATGYLISLVLILISCSCGSNVQVSDGIYEVTLSDADKEYLPRTPSQLDDPIYMKLINALIEEKTTSISSDHDFLDIVKAVAWTESKWRHYYEQNGKYYVFMGDQGHSFGIMQINDSYHNQYPVLQENIEYGINFAYEKYQNALSYNCTSGSNSGTDLIHIARRTYAQYNGGDSNICRDNDLRDKNLQDALSNKIWLNYF